MTHGALHEALLQPIQDHEVEAAVEIVRLIDERLATAPGSNIRAGIAGLAIALANLAKKHADPGLILLVAEGAVKQLTFDGIEVPANIPASLQPMRSAKPQLLAMLASVTIPEVRVQAERWARTALAELLVRCETAPEPIHQLGPVIAATRLLAGLALLLGDPGAIDVVCESARRMLLNGSATFETILRSDA